MWLPPYRAHSNAAPCRVVGSNIENKMKIDANISIGHWAGARRSIVLFQLGFPRIKTISSSCTRYIEAGSTLHLVHAYYIAFECFANLLCTRHVYFLVNFPRIITIILRFFLIPFFVCFVCACVPLSLRCRSRRTIYLCGKCKYLICSILADSMRHCDHRSVEWIEIYLPALACAHSGYSMDSDSRQYSKLNWVVRAPAQMGIFPKIIIYLIKYLYLCVHVLCCGAQWCYVFRVHVNRHRNGNGSWNNYKKNGRNRKSIREEINNTARKYLESREGPYAPCQWTSSSSCARMHRQGFSSFTWKIWVENRPTRRLLFIFAVKTERDG